MFPKFRCRSFASDRRGVVSILTTLLLLPLAAFAGAAMDYARLISAHTVLQGAVDAAALQAGGMLRETEEARRAAGRKIYDAQMAAFGDTIDHSMEFDFSKGNGRVEATGWVDIPTTLLKVIGKNELRASVVSTITARQDQVNMSLVLDVTGSLSDADLRAIKAAAKELVGIVLDDGQETDHFISMVPFAQFVNIGTGSAAEAVLDKAGTSAHSGQMLKGKVFAKHLRGCDEAKTAAARKAIIEQHFAAMKAQIDAMAYELEQRSPPYAQRFRRMMSYEGQAEIKSPVDCLIRNPATVSNWELLQAYPGVSWGGCVEARPAPNDINVVAPNASAPNTLFVPFYQIDGAPPSGSPDRYPNFIKEVTFNPTTNTDQFLHIDSRNGAGQQMIEDVVAGREFSILKYLNIPGALRNPNVRYHEDSICPAPMTPLTHDVATLKADIDKLVHVRAGGTNIGEGLMWGWRSLSGDAPFPLPAGIAAPEMRKRVLVVMTDGENNVNETGGWNNTPFRTQYTPYNHAGSGRLSNVTNRSTANTHFDKRMEAACEAAKKDDIEIYTVLFRNVNLTRVWNLLRACATNDTYAFKANNSDSLMSTFRAIAQRMSSLYISH